jgi:hypothetical protein
MSEESKLFHSGAMITRYGEGVKGHLLREFMSQWLLAINRLSWQYMPVHGSCLCCQNTVLAESPEA